MFNSGELERYYNLNNRADQEEILKILVTMGTNQTLSFLLHHWPLQGEVGKLGFNVTTGRKFDDYFYMDIQAIDNGLQLIATSSDLDQSDD